MSIRFKLFVMMALEFFIWGHHHEQFETDAHKNSELENIQRSTFNAELRRADCWVQADLEVGR